MATMPWSAIERWDEMTALPYCPLASASTVWIRTDFARTVNVTPGAKEYSGTLVEVVFCAAGEREGAGVLSVPAVTLDGEPAVVSTTDVFWSVAAAASELEIDAVEEAVFETGREGAITVSLAVSPLSVMLADVFEVVVVLDSVEQDPIFVSLVPPAELQPQSAGKSIRLSRSSSILLSHCTALNSLASVAELQPGSKRSTSPSRSSFCPLLQAADDFVTTAGLRARCPVRYSLKPKLEKAKTLTYNNNRKRTSKITPLFIYPFKNSLINMLFGAFSDKARFK